MGRRLAQRARRLTVLGMIAASGLVMLSQRPSVAANTAVDEEEHGGDIVFHVQSRLQKHSVLYSHDDHLAAGLDCADCHESIFKKEFQGNRFKMADINKGQACGVCHTAEPADGVQGSFPPKKNCDRCHSLRVREPEVRQR